MGSVRVPAGISKLAAVLQEHAHEILLDNALVRAVLRKRHSEFMTDCKGRLGHYVYKEWAMFLLNGHSGSILKSLRKLDIEGSPRKFLEELLAITSTHLFYMLLVHSRELHRPAFIVDSITGVHAWSISPPKPAGLNDQPARNLCRWLREELASRDAKSQRDKA